LIVLTVLRQRNFALLWVGGLASSIGSTMLVIALPFYVYTRTGSALATGVMFIAETVPAVLLGSVAGVFVDRWDRRRTMIVADVSRAALLPLLLAIPTRDGLWVIYVVAAAESAISQFFAPANGALLPRLVGERDLIAANSLTALATTLTLLVAPSIGGALLGLLGLPSIVLADSASYLMSGALVALIRAPSEAMPRTDMAHATALAPWRRIGHEWVDGLRVMCGDRTLTVLVCVMGLSSLAQGIFTVLLAPLVKDVLLGSALVFGWLATAQGVGGLLGGLVVGRVGRAAMPERLIGLALLALGVLVLIMINVPIIALAVVLFALTGMATVAKGVGARTVMQGRVADRYRGRVLGAIGTTGAVLTLGGMGLASGVTDHLGIVPVLDAAGGFWLLAGALAVVMLRGNKSPSDASAAQQSNSAIDHGPVLLPQE
jgi:MFS family permease